MVNALAYTMGQDMVFGAGQYALGTVTGKQLIAHELTHVLQQQGVLAGAETGVVQRDPLTYIAQLPPDQCARHLVEFDRSVLQIERQIQGVTGAEAADLNDALTRLHHYRQVDRVTCWRISGGLYYASYNYQTDQIRLHVVTWAEQHNGHRI